MNRLFGAALVTACAALWQPALATPITYTLTGTLSGTVTDAAAAVTPITNQSFVWTVEADTGAAVHIVQPPPPFPIAVVVVPAAADVISIGASTLTPTIPTYYALAPAFGIAGFSDITTSLGLSWIDPPPPGYDGLSNYGPIGVRFDQAGALPTDHGLLLVTAASDLVFTAVLDEPSPLALLLVGMAGCAVAVRIRRGAG